jgi:hypothetical protein
MRIGTVAPLALVLLASCGSSTNPLGPGGGGGGGGTTPPPAAVTVPEVLSNNVTSIAYDAANDRLLVQIEDLDTTPVVAAWERDPRFDTAGYRAYAVQEDPLDRLFVGLAAQSADGSVNVGLAGDGGQFNKFYSGGVYSRVGAFTPPAGTPTPGSGQVSYAGTYAGLTNIPAPGTGLLPVPPGTPPETLPGQTARVEGNIFLNVNFGDNAVNGAIYDRVLIDYGFGLQSVILVEGAIAANGSFTGQAERWVADDPGMAGVGDFGGVFGGANAGNVGGIVALQEIYYGEDVGDAVAGDVIENGLERGMFLLRQCGLSGDAPICDTTLPDFGN